MEANFTGDTPFKFDLAGMIAEEHEAHNAAISAVPVPSSVLHDVVRQYLKHYGYADTLTAFEKGCAATPSPSGGCTSMEEDTPDTTALHVRKQVNQEAGLLTAHGGVRGLGQTWVCVPGCC